MFPNERFLSETPFVKAETILTHTAHAPAGAWDDHGNDVLPLLRNVDHQYVKDFTNLPYAGFTNSHTLTLDLGTWTPESRLLLSASRFHRIFFCKFDVRGVAGRYRSSSTVRGGATTGRFVAANRR